MARNETEPEQYIRIIAVFAKVTFRIYAFYTL